MPDYTNYTFEDFVQDRPFRRWVLTNAPNDQAFWNGWLRDNPDKLDLVLAARLFVTQMRAAQEEISDEELAQEVAQIQINRQQAQDQPALLFPGRWFTRWVRVAAVVALVSLGVWWFLQRQSADAPAGTMRAYQQVAEQRSGPLRQVRNETDTSQLIILPDGSQVTLRKGSQLCFPRTASARQREVFLVGEAFFNVVRRPKQPFMVYTTTLTTKVLGTSFTVRAYADDKEANVIVRTGKVSVFTNPDGEKLGESASKQPAFILTPNQQLTFDRQAKQMKRSLVALPEPIVLPAVQAQLMVFDHTPVVSVFKKLEAAYGILINYDADLLAGCELTAEFGSESLFDKLDLICRATESRYEVIDAQVVIYSKGCRQPN